MSNQNFISQILQHLIFSLPVLVVAVTGLILSISLRERSAKAAGLLAAGCLLLLAIYLVVFPFINVYQMRLMTNAASGNRGSMSLLMSVVSFVRSIAHATGVGLIVAAAVVDRAWKAAPGQPYGG